jgi:hypothetical protein
MRESFRAGKEADEGAECSPTGECREGGQATEQRVLAAVMAVSWLRGHRLPVVVVSRSRGRGRCGRYRVAVVIVAQVAVVAVAAV